MNKEIEKEFERMWEEDDHNYGDFKQFISQAIAQTREETIREVEGKIMNIELAVDTKTIKKIEELSFKAEVIGYTQAMVFKQLEKILNKLKK